MRFFFQSPLEAARALNSNTPPQRLEEHMHWRFIGKLWLTGLGIFVLGSLLMGCSGSRWSPTDPRVDSLDPDNVEIIERWEVTVDAGVTP